MVLILSPLPNALWAIPVVLGVPSRPQKRPPRWECLTSICSVKLREARERKLTSREREILLLVTEGKSSVEIAEDLEISHKTVQTHRTNLMRKLAIRNVAGLVRYVLRRQQLGDSNYRSSP